MKGSRIIALPGADPKADQWWLVAACFGTREEAEAVLRGSIRLDQSIMGAYGQDGTIILGPGHGEREPGRGVQRKQHAALLRRAARSLMNKKAKTRRMSR